jgi:AcrR family transcriptional regulator
VGGRYAAPRGRGHAKGIEDTRAALIETAWSLIALLGYEAATIETIIEKTGVSKGAFYHHFRSKGDILDAVVGLMTERGMEALKPVLTGEHLSGLEQLDHLVSAIRGWRVTNINAVAGVGRALYRVQNLALKDKLVRSSAKAMVPALMESLENQRFGPQATALVMDQLDLLLESFERLLAAPRGCLTRPNRGDAEAFCRIISAEGETQ